MVIKDKAQIGKITPDGLVLPELDVLGNPISRPFSTHQIGENLLVIPLGLKEKEFSIEHSEPQEPSLPKKAKGE
jgi:hypothetical protein